MNGRVSKAGRATIHWKNKGLRNNVAPSPYSCGHGPLIASIRQEFLVFPPNWQRDTKRGASVLCKRTPLSLANLENRMSPLTFSVTVGVGILLLVGAGWLLHCIAIRLEDAGYLYYRERSRGGGGSVFSELDKLVRPSIEHTIEVQDGQMEQDEHAGD